ncbi:hypothetical protein LOZ80_34640 [Paenibacillus sp. HWE-109]|uniref:hypothetical protein n=1 Tax=Paenibacillus sp. HWE-109 TaxID=1306526 RepID=UPI001EE0DF95|nr:hypothetical protein [Paenibacillus sp. HWE-109]UKS26597.1 hypothetical protein LOZ80_34640 [Paenibacillus sp. HWE-109]
MIEIQKYLPTDAKGIVEKIDGKTILLGYISEKTGEVFSSEYSQLTLNQKGMILIRVGEGTKGSTVRREGETVARMTVGIDFYSLNDLGLKQ